VVAEVRLDYETEWAAVKTVATRLGIGTAETVRQWVRRDQTDSGARPPCHPAPRRPGVVVRHDSLRLLVIRGDRADERSIPSAPSTWSQHIPAGQRPERTTCEVRS